MFIIAKFITAHTKIIFYVLIVLKIWLSLHLCFCRPILQKRNKIRYWGSEIWLIGDDKDLDSFLIFQFLRWLLLNYYVNQFIYWKKIILKFLTLHSLNTKKLQYYQAMEQIHVLEVANLTYWRHIWWKVKLYELKCAILYEDWCRHFKEHLRTFSAQSYRTFSAQSYRTNS